jgi:hypothetical protein
MEKRRDISIFYFYNLVHINSILDGNAEVGWHPRSFIERTNNLLRAYNSVASLEIVGVGHEVVAPVATA